MRDSQQNKMKILGDVSTCMVDKYDGKMSLELTLTVSGEVNQENLIDIV